MGIEIKDESVLNIRSLVKLYGTRRVLDDVSLQVQPKEIVTVLGGKGAGKRTLVRLIGGDATPDKGSICCCGKDVTKYGASERLALGIGFSDPHRFPDRGFWHWLRRTRLRPVREMLISSLKKAPFSRTLGRKRTRAEMLERCDQVLEQFGLSSQQNRIIETMSGGERMRATIANIVVVEPSVLVIDQPFKGIEPVTQDNLQGIWSSLKSQGISILVTDYRPEALQNGDRFYLLHDGKITAQGTPEEIVAHPAFSAYLDSAYAYYGQADDRKSPSITHSMANSSPSGQVRVFVSYRRDDSAYATGSICEKLVARFGSNSVFRDVDTIPLGRDFRAAIEESLNSCGVVLVVIGDRWLDLRDAQGRRRLDNPEDFVRIEVEIALSRQVPVVPVLVGRAQLPPESDLPSSLRPLVFRQSTDVRPTYFKLDIENLILRLEEHIGTV